MIEEATAIISAGKDLDSGQMTAVMEEIMSGKAETRKIVAFLAALSDKGETVEELTAAVEVMRRHVTPVRTKHKVLLDTCGTGGDAQGTFNVSTIVAFVVSGTGIAVAKHGNRSVTSRSGSADILEALGVNICLPVEKLEACLNEVGIAFLFAPNLHPAMKYAMPARKELGRRTIFNILGPLTNPAGATHQLVGVFDAAKTELLARTLANAGTVHALVVHGDDGLDEITTTSETIISESYKGEIKSYRIRPEDYGFTRVKLADLAGGDAFANARIFLDCLNGKTGPARDIVLLNAGAAIYAADKVDTIKEGIELAELSIDSGRAMERFEKLEEFSNL
ncbi:MAG: anthranilate phosphoribosyltransferase [Candidatus Omnitrophica bacterium]|nr:anthranilate phosphoribosyltransferase [Candidatus Omnitrophota bacterium]